MVGVGLHSGDCRVALWGVLGYMVGVLSYMVESVGLYGGVLDYMMGCWAIWWGIGFYDGVLGYMVGIVR